jgi:hypothetical protein
VLEFVTRGNEACMNMWKGFGPVCHIESPETEDKKENFLILRHCSCIEFDWN